VRTDAFITWIHCRDLGSSERFYRDVVGWPLALEQVDTRVFRVRPGAYLGVLAREPVAPRGALILCIVADDVDGWHARLLAAGAPVDGPPRENPRYGIYHFFFSDPDGHRLEVQRFLDPRWDRAPAVDAPAGDR